MKLKCPECGKELKYSFWKLFGDGLVECLDCSIRIDILSGSIKPSVVNEAVSADTDSNSTDTEAVSTENPSPAVTTAPSRSTSAVPPAPSRTTIPGAQRVDPTPMTDRQLWEQIEYNTRMSADVLHRMWVVVVISMVLSVIGGIAMAAFQ
jgi:hypothetical protein